jgi:CheY-like chemotaxis protein
VVYYKTPLKELKKSNCATVSTSKKRRVMKKFSILHVDDHAGIRQVIASLLKDKYDLVQMGDLPSKEEIEKGNYDLVILDNSLPSGSGINFAKTLSDKQLILILSTETFTEEELEGLPYLGKFKAGGELIPLMEKMLNEKK